MPRHPLLSLAAAAPPVVTLLVLIASNEVKAHPAGMTPAGQSEVF